MQLYSYYRSSCSYRVRIALNLKQIPYEIIPVHLVRDGGEQHSADYKRINPMSVVPSLVSEGLVLTQSMAIIQYIESKSSISPLFGSSEVDRAKINEICEIINSGIQPIQNLAVNIQLKQSFNINDEQKNQWNRHWITCGFQALELIVAKSCGKFCFKDQPTAADCFLVPQIYNANRFSVDMNQFPNLQRINQHCLELEEFNTASPEKQVDFPQD